MLWIYRETHLHEAQVISSQLWHSIFKGDDLFNNGDLKHHNQVFRSYLSELFKGLNLLGGEEPVTQRFNNISHRLKIGVTRKKRRPAEELWYDAAEGPDVNRFVIDPGARKELRRPVPPCGHILGQLGRILFNWSALTQVAYLEDVYLIISRVLFTAECPQVH